jgi:hypothetical protein
MIAAMVQELEMIRSDLLFTVRNKLGLTREEAKKVFHRFRSPEAGGSGSGPELPGGEEMRAVMKHVQETAERLDRIEKDLDYLKKQVDRILEKV